MAWIAAALNLLAVVCMASFEQQASDIQTAARTPDREHWMQQAIQALYDLKSPCPFEAFGTVIVNHTAKEDDLICIGANAISSGNPTLHGEIAAINNCTAVLTDPNGRYRLSSAETLEAYKSLTLYTTAEPCPMCASAVRWTGFRECVFGTSISTLGKYGWTQIDFTSQELFEHTTGLKTKTNLAGPRSSFTSWSLCTRNMNDPSINGRWRAYEREDVYEHEKLLAERRMAHDVERTIRSPTVADQYHLQENFYPQGHGRMHSWGENGGPQNDDLARAFTNPFDYTPDRHTAPLADDLFSPRQTLSVSLQGGDRARELEALANHYGQAGLRDVEAAVARKHEINNIHTPMRILGYELDRGKDSMTETLVPFWRVEAGPVQRLESLVRLFHEELDRLAICLREPTSRTAFAARALLWKEDVLRQLMTNVGPAVDGVARRIGMEVNDVIIADGGPLRL
ncbi:hypothetical protein LTR10_002065 [Elasticomyces elasticus]|nr:hypothetical protein LTR10_002065 [Elasticomyces elasticus]KAK4973862.1 hypothetical protein LTR42_005852 [Elasticomyces elasticus]